MHVDVKLSGWHNSALQVVFVNVRASRAKWLRLECGSVASASMPEDGTAWQPS